MIEKIKLDGKLKEAYETLSSLAAVAYKDVYLLSNQVLSKNPFSSNYLKNFLADKNNAVPSLRKTICKLTKYYTFSLYYFSLYLTKYIIHRINGTRFKVCSDKDELIIVDTFFLCDKIIESNHFDEMYFKGLDHFFDESGRNYVFLPVLYGSNSLSVFCKVMKILKQDQLPVLNEYQLLSLWDLLKLFVFILAYPWHVLIFINKLKGAESTSGIKLAKYEIMETLDQVTFQSFSRYLQGEKIARLEYKKIKLISWYENQVIDKNLYKGLRADRNKVIIYGAQLFLYSKTDLNIIVDEHEAIHDIIPDRIIVNGSYFKPDSKILNYCIGPSLRYNDLFQRNRIQKSQKHILVMLSYDERDSRNILKIIADSKVSREHILIKPHPASSIEKIINLIFPEFKIRYENIYDLFEISKIAIGSVSGSLIEAASYGIPVIAIDAHHSFKYDILPQYGKGIIWDEVKTGNELTAAINKYKYTLKSKKENISTISDLYKNTFFCQPTKEKIIEAFDLGQLH